VIALSATLRADGRSGIRSRVAAFLIHLAVLRHCSLPDRPCDLLDLQPEDRELDDIFWNHFSNASIALIQRWSDDQFHGLFWDIFDLLDGRIFQVAKERLRVGGLSAKIVAAAEELANQIAEFTNIDRSCFFRPTGKDGETLVTEYPNAITSEFTTSVSPKHALVLPFHHRTINGLLKEVQLDTEADTGERGYSKVFQEATHWHNAKISLDPKHIPKPPGFYAQKRNQKFMADTIA